MQGGRKARWLPRIGVLMYRLFPPRMFDAPYMTTIGAQNGGWVRYQLLPAAMGKEHHVNPVYHEVWVQETVMVKIPSNFFHCVDCKLMGTTNTMQEYTCS